MLYLLTHVIRCTCMWWPSQAHAVTIKSSPFFWSCDFRPLYGFLHEIWALVPKGTPFLACTATVTHSIQHEVIQSFEMVYCELISTSPDRANIYFEVRPCTEIDTDWKTVICSLKEHKNRAPRVIVYWRSREIRMCRSVCPCTSIMSLAMTRTTGSHKISDNGLFRMFHANTPQYNKEVILEILTQPNGIARVVFAMIALGMGVNLRDLRKYYNSLWTTKH